MPQPSMPDLLGRHDHDAAAPPDAELAPGATTVVEGPTAEAALATLHDQLGVTAKVVEVRKVHRGGIGGFFARELVQIHAADGAAEPAGDRPDSGLDRAPRDVPADATDTLDFATFLRGQLDEEERDDPELARQALIDRATAAARAAAAPVDTGRVVEPDEAAPDMRPGADPDPDADRLRDLVARHDTVRSIDERTPATTSRQEAAAAVAARAAAERAAAAGAQPPSDARVTSGPDTATPPDLASVADPTLDPEAQRAAAERAAAAARLAERSARRAAPATANPAATARADAAASRLADRCRVTDDGGCVAERIDVEPRPSRGAGPAWSVSSLVALGLPTELLRGLQVADPADDLAWTVALADALRPLCRPLPTDPAVLVGPRVAHLAGPLGLPTAEPAPRLRDHAPLTAVAAGGDRATLDLLEPLAATHGFHLVVGGRGWRRLALLQPSAVSWTAPEHATEAIRLAAELGLVLGWGCDHQRQVVRAAPLELALTVRALLPTR